MSIPAEHKNKARAQIGKTIFGRPKPPPAPQSKRALDYEGLRAKGIHYHRNYLRRLWDRGDFPRPFKPTPRRLAWWEEEIDAWLEQKVLSWTNFTRRSVTGW